MVATAENPTAARKSHLRIPLPLKLKARSLYLIHGLPYAEIAAQTGLNVRSVRNLAWSEGWVKSKQQAKAELIKRADARAQAKMDEVAEAIAVDSEEIAMMGLANARKSAASNSEVSAKKFQAWTGGARNLVNIARACRGLDGPAKGGDGGAGATINLAFFVGNIGAGNPIGAKAEPRNVTPAAARDALCAGPVVHPITNATPLQA